jgi:hypothetical protein
MPTLIKRQRRELAIENIKWPRELREIPPHQWPGYLDGIAPKRPPMRLFRSRDYLVQVYDAIDDHLRLTVNRMAIDDDGRWRDGITWDDLQRLKREAGYGSWWAVEIYPADACIINDAPMRHLWMSQRAVAFGWLEKPREVVAS